MSIRLKIIAALVVGLFTVAGVTAVLMRFVHDRAVRLATEREVRSASEALVHLESLEADRMRALLDVILSNDALAARLEAGDRSGLLSLTRPIFESLRSRHGVTHWYFHPPAPARDGVFLRVHHPALFGDPVQRPVVARAVAGRAEATGRELGRTAFALRVVRPWLRGDRLIGYVELGVDVPAFLARLKAVTGDEYGMLLGKAGLAPGAAELGAIEPWEARPGLVAVGATGAPGPLLAGFGVLEDLPAAPTALGEVHTGAAVLARGVFPLVEGGRTIGAIVLLHDVTALHAGGDEVRTRVVLLVALLAAGLSAFVVFLLEALVFERLARMTRALEELPDRLARGDWEPPEPAPGPADEVGRFERFFARLLREVGSFVSDARRDAPARAAPRARDVDPPGGI